MKPLNCIPAAMLIVVASYLSDASPAQQAAPISIPKPAELSNTFSSLAKKLEPTVVTIVSTVGPSGRRRSSGGDQAEDEDEMMRRFFGNNIPQRRGYQMGSGVVVDPNGYILTNHHVI